MAIRILQGDALVRLAELEAGSVDAVVTDPPAGISFMGRTWDSDRGGRRQWVAWMTEIFTEVYRVMKPGAHGLVWALPRTSHWTAWALEDAGFEVRDKVLHLFGSGFPKSLDVSKAIDKMRRDDVRPVCRFLAAHMGSLRITDIVKAMGFDGNGDHGVSAWFRDDHVSPRCPTWDQWLALKELLNCSDDMDTEVWRLNGRKGRPGEAYLERALLGTQHRNKPSPAIAASGFGADGFTPRSTEAVTDAARQWQGWGTALKPAYEDWWLIRKPLAGNVAQNVLTHGTGALNVDGCRLGTSKDVPSSVSSVKNGVYGDMSADRSGGGFDPNLGRWPANCVLSHEDGCREIGTKQVPSTGGSSRGTALGRMNDDAWQPAEQAISRPSPTVVAWECVETCAVRMLDLEAGVSRSSGLYAAQDHGPNGKHRSTDFGGRGTPATMYADHGGPSRYFYCAKASPAERGAFNSHPCVKPLTLMSWLVKLVTPPGGTVLDPFMGSGSTLIAADRLGFDSIGLDNDPHAVEIAQRRLTEDAGFLADVTVEAAG